MGNNPVSGVDPDGGFLEEFEDDFLTSSGPTLWQRIKVFFGYGRFAGSGDDLIYVPPVQSTYTFADKTKDALARMGSNAAQDFEGATIIVNGIDRSIFNNLIPNLIPKYGGNSPRAVNLREQGESFGYGVQLDCWLRLSLMMADRGK